VATKDACAFRHRIQKMPLFESMQRIVMNEDVNRALGGQQMSQMLNYRIQIQPIFCRGRLQFILELQASLW
jgi:hypothetical protein